MSERVAPLGAMRSAFARCHPFPATTDVDERLAEFDRRIAEVERSAAYKALTDAAEQFATQDGIEALMFAHDDVTAVQATEKWLIDRAAALGLTAGQEGQEK